VAKLFVVEWNSLFPVLKWLITYAVTNWW